MPRTRRKPTERVELVRVELVQPEKIIPTPTPTLAVDSPVVLLKDVSIHGTTLKKGMPGTILGTAGDKRKVKVRDTIFWIEKESLEKRV